MRLKLTVAIVGAFIWFLLILSLLVGQAQARPPVPAPVFKAVRTYWHTKPERIKTFDVIWCESRYSIWAENGQYLGLFQMGDWARSTYGHGYSAMAQARSAHRYYMDSGWTGWECA
jgi:hypothetical protein